MLTDTSASLVDVAEYAATIQNQLALKSDSSYVGNALAFESPNDYINDIPDL